MTTPKTLPWLRLAAVVLLVAAYRPMLVAASDAPAPADALAGKWIWLPQTDFNPYNQTVIARKSFRLEKPVHARLRLTADSWYRLTINGQWVNDGPARSWPEHYQFDTIDVGPYLQEGENVIEVVARYFGVGEFHTVPRQAGLWAQLDVTGPRGQIRTIATDSSWQVAEGQGWIRNTPKISIQMEAAELYDARQAGPLTFHPAQELFPAESGPWKDLHAREVALPRREATAFQAYGGAQVVRADGLNFTLPAVRLMHPGLIEANREVAAPCGMASVLQTETGCTLHLELTGMKLAVDGQAWDGHDMALLPGRHLVLAFVDPLTGHDKDRTVRFMQPQGFRLVNPLEPTAENPWCFLPLAEYNFAAKDLLEPRFISDNPALAGRIAGYDSAVDRWLHEVKSPQDFATALAGRARLLPSAALFVRDYYWQFVDRQVVRDGTGQVEAPAAVLAGATGVTTVHPTADGDVELLYDLGEQNCGYYTFDLDAPAGTILDLCSTEYIAPDGRIQFPLVNRNGMRYIARAGENRYTSLKIRSGRYLFLTLRHQTGVVRIRHLGLIASTYPANPIGNFACSDPRLGQIWAISERTLRLCMQDTFIDCPLYEQTHWVGDARNEGLFAYSVFGATDIARNCIHLTAQSLAYYPFVGCQTPSGWDVMLPAWSFLWGISTWDYYWYTGDQAFLRDIYPSVMQNLRGAATYVNAQGLFSGPFWNFFDWTGIDSNQRTVLHNSLLMVGSIDAALREAHVLHNNHDVPWLQALRQRLVDGVNHQWNPVKRAYPDSLHSDGSTSLSFSQHTSFLSILYDVIEPKNRSAAVQNLTDPPKDMVRLGSPFTALYLDETWEKLGRDDQIIDEIYRDYLPMLAAGATTVWESFPSGTTGTQGFPTRSHCHAWSSAPVYYLNRIVLGIQATAPGSQTVAISPYLAHLTWARGTVATIHGPLTVAWKFSAENNTLAITCAAPPGVTADYAPNPSLVGLHVLYNGHAVP